jgi:WD40 repeat protein
MIGFSASGGALYAVASSAPGESIVAVGGSDERVQLFNVLTRRTCGDLYGHNGSITCLAFSPDNRYLLSGAEDGEIIIWRLSDCMALHKLNVKNVQKVISMAMHPSGRMIIALYANGMIRLWNLLDARCLFKKKVGLSGEDASEDEYDDEDEAEGSEKAEPKELAAPVMTNKYLNRPELVRWEPTEGKMYAVLFGRLLEVFTVEDDGDTPVHSVKFDSAQTSFAFISATSLVVSDLKGRLTLFSNLGDVENVTMRITETESKKIKVVSSSPDQTFFVTIGDDHLSLWNSEDFAEAGEADQEGDLICKATPEQEYSHN